jgi:hypothetical protein
MTCDGTPLGEDQKPGWCCGKKEIPKEDVKHVLGVAMPFCHVWIAEMRKRDREYPRDIVEMKKRRKA